MFSAHRMFRLRLHGDIIIGPKAGVEVLVRRQPVPQSRQTSREV